MPKDDLVYVGHMLDTARLAVHRVTGCQRQRFDSNNDLRLALAHLIQTIGEAARHVSPNFQEKHKTIPWAKVIGMRHKIVHDYMHVDYDLVWDVATLELPALIDALTKVMPSNGA